MTLKLSSHQAPSKVLEGAEWELVHLQGENRCVMHPNPLPGVLLPGAASAIERDDLVSTDAGFANWTHLSIRSCLQPLQTESKMHYWPKAHHRTLIRGSRIPARGLKVANTSTSRDHLAEPNLIPAPSTR
jgi:hypothetical protein